jgi:hypothetical protein
MTEKAAFGRLFLASRLDMRHAVVRRLPSAALP